MGYRLTAEAHNERKFAKQELWYGLLIRMVLSKFSNSADVLYFFEHFSFSGLIICFINDPFLITCKIHFSLSRYFNHALFQFSKNIQFKDSVQTDSFAVRL